MFNLDFAYIIECLLPPFLRGPKMLAWLISLTKPIETLYNTFQAFRSSSLDKVSYNSQIIYLEKLLNDRFNPSMVAPIYIADVANISYTYVANKAEGYDPIYIGNKAEAGTPLYIGNRSEYQGQYEFKVMVPAAVYADLLADNEALLNTMKALINFYKLAGKRYLIQSY